MDQRAESELATHPADQPEKGGSIPTSALQLRVVKIEFEQAREVNGIWHSRLPHLGTGCVKNMPYLSFAARASDTKMLIQVTGPCVAPNDAEGATLPCNLETLIDAETWKKAFALDQKEPLPGCRRQLSPKAEKVAVETDGKDVTFRVSTKDKGQLCLLTQSVEGRMPPLERVLDGVVMADRFARVSVDPRKLIVLLKTLTEFCDEDKTAVEIRISDDARRPLLLMTPRRGDGVEATAILMPLLSE